MGRWPPMARMARALRGLGVGVQDEHQHGDVPCGAVRAGGGPEPRARVAQQRIAIAVGRGGRKAICAWMSPSWSCKLRHA
mmetsp:Transcript_17732/g.56687  ORF Transcript_17732/g.56687 Transcript_17732/m.56687 type:complete len:80 (+) Transcript_17732:630-869(+)